MDIPQELIDAFTSGRDQLLAIEGVLGASIGQAEDATGQPTGEVSIRVHVDDVNDPPAGLPSEVGGFPPVLVQRGQIQLDADLARYDPIVGSCSVANVDRPQPGPFGLGQTIGAGTLGSIARDNATGALVGLSNYHVFCQPGFAAGDQTSNRSLRPSVVRPPTGWVSCSGGARSPQGQRLAPRQLRSATQRSALLSAPGLSPCRIWAPSRQWGLRDWATSWPCGARRPLKRPKAS